MFITKENVINMISRKEAMKVGLEWGLIFLIIGAIIGMLITLYIVDKHSLQMCAELFEQMSC